MIFHSHATKTHFHKKDSALFLVFKVLDSFSVFRVRLGHLSSFLSTSCITSLHFIPDSDQGKWYFSVINFRFYFRRLPIPVFHLPGGGEEGSPLFGLYGYVLCASGHTFQGLESYTGYAISLLSVLNRVSFRTGSLSKSLKTCDERSTFAIPIILLTFFLYFQ